MNVEIRLGAETEARIIGNLWPLYQHDVSAFDGAAPNRHGIFGSDDTTTLAQHVASLDPWWGNPETLFPYLIVVDGAPAGFDLIAARPWLPRGIEADFVVHEFFVLHAYRGSPAAERAAIQGFDRHRGRWEVVTYPTHAQGIAFWRRVIGDYTSMQFSEGEVDHPWGRRVAFHFDNAGSATVRLPPPALISRTPSRTSCHTSRSASSLANAVPVSFLVIPDRDARRGQTHGNCRASPGHGSHADGGESSMFGRRRTITCPGGAWTAVIRTPFAQMPVTWTLRLVADGGAVAGEFEEIKSTWVFPGTPRTGPLQPEMVFERGYWNTFYTLRFRPVDTLTVTIE